MRIQPVIKRLFELLKGVFSRCLLGKADFGPVAILGGESLVVTWKVSVLKDFTWRSVETRPHVVLHRPQATGPRVLIGKCGPLSVDLLLVFILSLNDLDGVSVFQAIGLEGESWKKALLTHHLIEFFQSELEGGPLILELLRNFLPQQSQLDSFWKLFQDLLDDLVIKMLFFARLFLSQTTEFLHCGKAVPVVQLLMVVSQVKSWRSQRLIPGAFFLNVVVFGKVVALVFRGVLVRADSQIVEALLARREVRQLFLLFCLGCDLQVIVTVFEDVQLSDGLDQTLKLRVADLLELEAFLVLFLI